MVYSRSLRAFACWLVVGSALVLSACGGGSASATGQLQVTLERNPLAVGETASLQARLVDANGNPLPNAQFIVESTEPFIAAVNGEDGTYLVRALAEGRAQVRVREPRTGAQRTIEVAVVSPPLRAARLEIIAERTTLAVGETVTYRAVVYDESNQVISAPVRWFSSDPAIVQVNTSGVVSARAVGQASILARMEDESLSASVTVQVVQNLPGSSGMDVTIN